MLEVFAPCRRLPRLFSTGTINLPPIIQNYIDASNARDVQSLLACFTEDAVIRDENATLHGKIEIEPWISTTIQKCKFQFDPVSDAQGVSDLVVTVKVSGTFP